MKIKQRLFKSTSKSVLIFLIVVGVYGALLPTANFARTKRHVAQDGQFDKKFREGRDLIDQEEWARAAVKFSDIITYPKNKSTDAALYWLAFCYKKQKKFKETEATLDRLLKDFPASSWADDAKVMKMEIELSVGKVYAPKAVGGFATLERNFDYDGAIPKNSVQGAVAAAFPGFAGNSGAVEMLSRADAPTPLDREDEIKLAAFQSLLAADPQRAIETMGDVLRSNSKARESLKQEILRALRSPRLTRTQGTLNLFAGSAGISKQFVPLLRDTLVKSFQNESNIKVRKEVIYALANINDDQSTEYLSQLYASENDREIKKAIINSFSKSPSNSFVYISKSNALTALTGADASRKIEFDKLMEIVRTEKDAELRRLAFSNLQRLANWTSNEKAVEVLAQMYDAETDEPFKMSIIRALANLKQAAASKKLLEIAGNDKSDKLKLEAIYALRTSNNPEVLKFLEDLIK